MRDSHAAITSIQLQVHDVPACTTLHWLADWYMRTRVLAECMHTQACCSEQRNSLVTTSESVAETEMCVTVALAYAE